MSTNGSFVICCQPPLDLKSVNPESIIILSTLNSLAAQFSTLREDIHDVKTSIATLNSRIDLHQSEIQSLKSKICDTGKLVDDLSTKVGKLPIATQINSLTMSEIDDLTTRKSNVILFNVTDYQSADKKLLQESDEKTINNLLTTLQLQDKVNICSHFRIRKPVSHSHT